MSFRQPGDFDIEALHAALEAQRVARGMSWAQVAREINDQFNAAVVRRISASTVTGMRRRIVVEGDGVLQMLRWLKRTPESFVPDLPNGAGEALPDVGTKLILRFDTKAIYAAINARRVERQMTWRQVAAAIGGLNAPMLTRLSQGGRTAFPHVMRIARWLGRSVASLTRASSI